MRTAGLIVGMILLVMGAQGAIRLMADHDDAGPLGWMPGGFAAQLSVYCLTVVVGTAIASHFARGPTDVDRPPPLRALEGGTACAVPSTDPGRAPGSTKARFRTLQSRMPGPCAACG